MFLSSLIRSNISQLKNFNHTGRLPFRNIIHTALLGNKYMYINSSMNWRSYQRVSLKAHTEDPIGFPREMKLSFVCSHCFSSPTGVNLGDNGNPGNFILLICTFMFTTFLLFVSQKALFPSLFSHTLNGGFSFQANRCLFLLYLSLFLAYFGIFWLHI